VNPFEHEGAVLLAGGGSIDSSTLSIARSMTDVSIAADGAADLLFENGVVPDAIVGDMDSLRDPSAWHARGVHVRALAEQETTDFEKCLYSSRASLYVGVGFTGKRVDHTLAALHAMVRHADKRVVLIDESDAIFAPGLEWTMATEPGDRISLYPIAPTRGVRSQGLEWPIEGLEFIGGERIGTSNRATGQSVSFAFDRPGMIVIVDRDRLAAIVDVWRVAAGEWR
jgi:thiamine pyrophosphokinase